MRDELSNAELLARDRAYLSTLHEEKRKIEEQIRGLQARVAEIVAQQEKVVTRIESREGETPRR